VLPETSTRRAEVEKEGRLRRQNSEPTWAAFNFACKGHFVIERAKALAGGSRFVAKGPKRCRIGV
jgi:hypothetical protein